MEFSGFDWDEGNRAKCAKHGVTQSEIEDLFRLGLTILPDDTHSVRERRFRGIGRNVQGRMLFVVFTQRKRGGEVLIRPISARYMDKKEIDHYAGQA